MIKDYENKAVKRNIIKIKLNVSLAGHPEGFIHRTQADANGVPYSRYWRDRIKDAKIDNCVEVITEKKTSARKKSEEEGVEK